MWISRAACTSLIAAYSLDGGTMRLPPLQFCGGVRLCTVNRTATRHTLAHNSRASECVDGGGAGAAVSRGKAGIGHWRASGPGASLQVPAREGNHWTYVCVAHGRLPAEAPELDAQI